MILSMKRLIAPDDIGVGGKAYHNPYPDFTEALTR